MATPQTLATAPPPPCAVLEFRHCHKDVPAKRDLGGDLAPITGEGRRLVVEGLLGGRAYQ